MQVDLSQEELERAMMACRTLVAVFTNVEKAAKPDELVGLKLLALAQKFADAIKTLAAADWLDKELERFRAAVDAVPAGDYQVKLGLVADRMKQLVDDWRAGKGGFREAPVPEPPREDRIPRLAELCKLAETVNVHSVTEVKAFSATAQPLLALCSVDTLWPGVRVQKALAHLKAPYVRQLVGLTEEQLLECRDFGVSSLHELRGKMAAFGLRLRAETSTIQEMLKHYNLGAISPQGLVTAMAKRGYLSADLS